MVGEDFAFNGSWLSDYDLKMYDPEDSQQFIGREIEKADISALREMPNHYSTHYTDVLVLSFLVLKNPDVYDTDDMKLTGDEVNEIRSWLESPKLPTEMHMLSVEDSFDTYYFGVFTSVQPYIIRQDCYGLYLTFTCNAPYGFSAYVTNRYNITGNNITNSSFYNQSAEKNSFVKPIIKIRSKSTFNGSESIELQNKSDGNNKMVIILPKGVNVLIIDCAKKQITDQDGNAVSMYDIGLRMPTGDNYNFISADTFLFYWFRLAYGANQLVFTPKNNVSISSVEISARYPRKSGGF